MDLEGNISPRSFATFPVGSKNREREEEKKKSRRFSHLFVILADAPVQKQKS
jgi:hypothetical protein